MSDIPKVHGVDEGIRAVSGPQALVVRKLGDVPHELEHDLGKLDGVALGAVAAAGGATEAAGAIRDVRLVVDAVEVLAVPAAFVVVNMSRSSLSSKYRSWNNVRSNSRGEDDSLPNHLASGVLGDGNGIAAGAGRATDELVFAGRGPAAVADVGAIDVGVIRLTSITGDHAEALVVAR